MYIAFQKTHWTYYKRLNSKLQFSTTSGNDNLWQWFHDVMKLSTLFLKSRNNKKNIDLKIVVA